MPCARQSSRACRRALLAGALVAATMAAPARAAITTVPLASAIDIDATAPLNVELVRNGIVIGRASGVPAPDRVRVNRAGACWSAFTPEIRGGDIVHAGGGMMTVQALTVGTPTIDAAAGVATVSGTIGTAVPGTLNVTIDGNAATVAPNGPNWSATLNFDPLGPAPAPSAQASFNGLDGGNTIVSTGDGPPGPGNGCTTTSPFHANAATAVDGGHLVGGVPTINIANAAQPLTVSGAGAASAPSLGGAPGALTPGAGTWLATFSPAELAALPDGPLDATPGPDGAALTILKDTTAPAAPASTPPPGRYVSPPTISLSGEPGSHIHFTADGSVPTSASPVYSAPIRLTNSATIRAIAVDAVGNGGPVAALAYQLGPGSGPPGGDGTPGDQNPKPGPGGGPGGGAAVARVSVLKVSKRQSLRRLRKNGLGVGVQLAKGTTAVRFMIYRRTKRGRRTVLRLVASLVRTPGTGRYRARLNARAVGLTRTGVYQLRVVPGTTRTTLDTSAARTVFLRVVR